MAGTVHARTRDRHLLLLTDFDGTLADLAPTPDTARMSDDVRQAMERLAGLPSVTLGVISGRRMGDVGPRVGPAASFVGGLHGLEIRGPGVEFHDPSLDEAERLVAGLRARATRELGWCPGIHLEDKRFALTCHVRLVPDDLGVQALAAFASLAQDEIAAGRLRLLRGAKALELLPPVDWHKGSAAFWIRDRVAAQVGHRPAVVYLGDDRTDEDAFRAHGDEDVMIGVGRRPSADIIDWRLASPADVGVFFGRLAECRSADPA